MRISHFSGKADSCSWLLVRIYESTLIWIVKRPQSEHLLQRAQLVWRNSTKPHLVSLVSRFSRKKIAGSVDSVITFFSGLLRSRSLTVVAHCNRLLSLMRNYHSFFFSCMRRHDELFARWKTGTFRSM